MVGRPDGDALGLSEEAAHNLRAVAQSGTVLVRGLQDVSREVADRSQQRLQRNLDGLQALARCRSMTDFVEVQSSLLRDNLEQTVENSRRIAELTIQMADEATRTVTVQAEKTAERGQPCSLSIAKAFTGKPPALELGALAYWRAADFLAQSQKCTAVLRALAGC